MPLNTRSHIDLLPSEQGKGEGGGGEVGRAGGEALLAADVKYYKCWCSKIFERAAHTTR